MKAELGSVAAPQEVLAIQVGDDHALVAAIEPVQLGVGILLEQVEHDEVVLPAVVVEVPEQARAEINVVEDEPAKVAVERLCAETAGDEIVVLGQIAQVKFGKPFL